MDNFLNKEKSSGFSCQHCHKFVPINEFIGTKNRNHCPFCLWSKHVDLIKPGDRKASCHTSMQPIGLTFKQEGVDKYGKLKQGELMLIHLCSQKDKISINRIAADDNEDLILKVFYDSQSLEQQTKQQLIEVGINLLTKKDEAEIKNQLFGKKIS
jgi:hypothetical protein